MGQVSLCESVGGPFPSAFDLELDSYIVQCCMHPIHPTWVRILESQRLVEQMPSTLMDAPLLRGLLSWRCLRRSQATWQTMVHTVHSIACLLGYTIASRTLLVFLMLHNSAPCAPARANNVHLRSRAQHACMHKTQRATPDQIRTERHRQKGGVSSRSERHAQHL